MKILHLVDEPWDSGVTHYALQIAQGLERRGHHVVVGVLPGKKPETLAKKLGLKTASIRSFLSYWSLFRSEAWDVINAHTGRTHTRAMGFRQLTRRPIAIIRTRGEARPLRVNALSRFSYRHTDGVISASDHMEREYGESFQIPEERLHTIYPAVEADSAYSLPPADRVGILGRLDPVKGHSVFLEAAAYIVKERPETQFLIAGKEANISVQMLQNQVKVLGIGSQVQFLGYQPSAQEFMRSCTIGVIASTGSEEISRACLEWMAVGRPVVATMVGSLPELVEPEETGFLVPPDDSSLMAKDILRLLKNPVEAEQLGQKGWETARRKFNSERMVDQTLALYRSATDARR